MRTEQIIIQFSRELKSRVTRNNEAVDFQRESGRPYFNEHNKIIVPLLGKNTKVIQRSFKSVVHGFIYWQQRLKTFSDLFRSSKWLIHLSLVVIAHLWAMAYLFQLLWLQWLVQHSPYVEPKQNIEAICTEKFETLQTLITFHYDGQHIGSNTPLKAIYSIKFAHMILSKSKGFGHFSSSHSWKIHKTICGPSDQIPD